MEETHRGTGTVIYQLVRQLRAQAQPSVDAEGVDAEACVEEIQALGFNGRSKESLTRVLRKHIALPSAPPCDHIAIKGNRCEMCQAPVVFVEASVGRGEAGAVPNSVLTLETFKHLCIYCSDGYKPQKFPAGWGHDDAPETPKYGSWPHTCKAGEELDKYLALVTVAQGAQPEEVCPTCHDKYSGSGPCSNTWHKLQPPDNSPIACGLRASVLAFGSDEELEKAVEEGRLGMDGKWLAAAGVTVAQGARECCGEVVAHLIAGASWFSCALPKGHEAEHRAAGNCFKHGEYFGEPHSVPRCPKWPDCATEAAPQKEGAK